MKDNLVVKLITVLIVIATLSGCSQYKSSWSCPNPEGIGCSSIIYADQVARKHIILAEPEAKKHNQDKNKPKILIREHYKDFNYCGKSEIDVD